MKVSIFGLGYVGCVTAACLAKDGHEVIGVDVVSSKVEKLAGGRATVVETGLDELIADGHKAGRIKATTNGRQAVLDSEASIVCVGTPTGADGSMAGHWTWLDRLGGMVGADVGGLGRIHPCRPWPWDEHGVPC